MKKSSVLLITFFLLGCESKSEKVILKTLDNENIIINEFYQNSFDETKIPEQKKGWNIGDPFVYRYNGMYYLIPSGATGEYGIRAWQSKDLLNWELVDNGINTKGYIAEDPILNCAYAPEMTYYDGYFYLCTSPFGEGHYFLRSESPIGPFELISGNVGQSIDGSFFVDDDEQLYFLRANSGGIRMAKLTTKDGLALDGGTILLEGANLSGWTEGPYLLKNNGTYYLTYTGNHVASRGYKVAYSTYQGNDVFSKTSMSENEICLLNTSDEFGGLGHSSTVMGPDMDSYYMAYHSRSSTGGRNFNLGRLFFSGTSMMVRNYELNNNISPSLPSFATYDDELDESNGFYLSNLASDDTFTAEFNLKNASNTKCIFSYIDNENYNYLALASNKIDVYQVINGKETLLTTGNFIKNYNIDKLHTLRVSYREGNLDVYYDNMCKIDDYKVTLNGGKIGYYNTNKEDIEYTAFSNVAQGKSDAEEVKQKEAFASNYSLNQSQLTNNSKIITKENGKEELLLNNAGDRAVYPFYFSTDGEYELELTLDKKYLNKKIGIQIDNGEIEEITIPNYETNDEASYVNVIVKSLNISKGKHYFNLIASSDEVAILKIKFNVKSENVSFTNSLNEEVTNVKYYNDFSFSEEGAYTESERALLYFNANGLYSNYTLECDVMIKEQIGAGTSGIIVRAINPAFSSYDYYTSFQGYYIAFNGSKFTISKCNYNNSITDKEMYGGSFASGQYYHLKITCKDNKIIASIDDIVTLTLIDDTAYLNGYFGLYNDGNKVVFKNLVIKGE